MLRLAFRPRAVTISHLTVLNPYSLPLFSMAPKRKRSAPSIVEDVSTSNPMPPPTLVNGTAKPQGRMSRRSSKAATNPDVNSQVLDGPAASRASPDNQINAKIAPDVDSDSPLSDAPDFVEPPKKKDRTTGRTSKATRVKVDPTDAGLSEKSGPKTNKSEDAPQPADPEAEGDEEANEEEIKEALSRPPPVNSDYLPLPWRGRLGYVRHFFFL